VAVASLAIPATAHAYHDEDTHIIDHTAHTLRGKEVRIGLWQIDVGIWRELNIGTDTLPIVGSFIIKRAIPNAHVKISPIHTPALTLSGEARGYWVTAGSDDAHGGVGIWLFTGFASTALTKNLSLHFETAYTTLTVAGAARATSLEAQGAVAVSSLQFGTMLEYRFTRVTAVTFRERYQPWFNPAVVHGSLDKDANTHLSVDANVEPRYRGGTLAFIGDVAFSWKNVNLQIGLGYGSIFLPSLGIVIPKKYVLPDLSFDVRF